MKVFIQASLASLASQKQCARGLQSRIVTPFSFCCVLTLPVLLDGTKVR